MSVSVGDTLEAGVRRLVTVPGSLMIAMFGAFRLANPVIYDTFFARGVEFALRKAGGYTLADLERELLQRGHTELLPLVEMVDRAGMDVPFPVAVAMLLALPFVAEFLHVVGIRALAARDPNSVPVDEVLSGLAGAYLKSVVASFVAVLLVLIGGVLVIPGIVLAVLFLFVRQRIALSGDGVFAALSESQRLVRENALQMVVLTVVFLLTWLVATFVAGMVPLGDLGDEFTRLVGTVVVVFGISLFTSAYLQAVDGVGGSASAAPAGHSDRLGA